MAAQLFFGDPATLGARPGLSWSGAGADSSLSTGSDVGFARSVVVAGMQAGRAGGPSNTSETCALTAAIVRSSQASRLAPSATFAVTVAVMPETRGTPAGTLSI